MMTVLRESDFPEWFVRDGKDAFELAITSGRLSADPKAPNYAGHFMYMGTRRGKDLFKHQDSREYLP